MKKLFYLLLLIAGFVNGQIVNIPDANFKAKLLAANSSNSTAYILNIDGTAYIPAAVDTNSNGEIEISEALVINYLNISNLGTNTPIASLSGIEYFSNLTVLDCSDNQITSLDLNQLTNLKILNCNSNLLTSLNLDSLINLEDFGCVGNQLTSLDFHNNSKLISFGCTNNNLYSINLKNGSSQSTIIGLGSNDTWLTGNTNLAFICVDEEEQTLFQSMITSFSNMLGGIPSPVLNSYCSFNPGGDYNTIAGALTYDANSDGCDANDAFIPNLKIKMQQWGLDSYTFSNNSGNYKFYTTFADQSVEPIFENPTYFNPSPASAVVSFPETNFLTSTQDFCITPNGIHPDLEIVLVPVTPARPGFDAVYNLVIKNKGNQSLSSWTGCLLNYDATKMTFVSASATITNATAGQLETGYSLNPFETQVIQFIFHINAPTDAVPVNIGDLLTFNATITSSATDETPLDNAFSYHQTVVGSFDPNDIACLEGATVSPTEIGNYLHYMVNFENTGNYAAENVVAKIEVDTTKYDVASLQLLDSSNPVDARVTGNKVEFIFKNIQLAGPGGHGNILLKIKTKNNLVTGDMVSKNANIYFDYNAPVTTFPFDTTFQTLGVNNPNLDDSIAVFPNPTSNFVTVNSKNTIKSLQLFDVQGRLLQTNFSNQKETKIDISAKANGVYFLKITSEIGVKIERVVKQ